MSTNFPCFASNVPLKTARPVSLQTIEDMNTIHQHALQLFVAQMLLKIP